MSDIVIVLKEGNPVERTKPKSWHISLPADVLMKDLLNALIPKLGLPTQRGGQITYKLHHVQSNRIIPDDETLTDAGVTTDDVCLLLREQDRRIRPQTHYQKQPGATLITTAHDIIAKSYALLSETCGRDGKPLTREDSVVCCPICGTPYHYQCWLANGNQCSQPGCEGGGTIQPHELVDQFWGMSDIIGELMEEFPSELTSETEEVFHELMEVDSQIIDRWDELEEEDLEELLEELGEEGIEYEDEDEEELEEPNLPVDIPSRLRFTQKHVWIDISSGRVGITDFLAQRIFLILDVELPEEGQRVSAGEVVSVIWALSESTKEVNVPVSSPASGVISAVNKKFKDRFLRSAEPELIQEDPYGQGWLFIIQLSESARTEIARLMDAETYQQFISTT